MDEFKKLIAEIRAGLEKATVAANDRLKNLPPVEQVQGAQAHTEIKRQVGYMVEDVERRLEFIAEQKDRLDGMLASAVQAALDERAEKKEIVYKTDHDAAVTAAVTAANEKAQAEHQTALDNLQNVAARREEAVTALGDSAAALTDEMLADEGYAATIATASERKTELEKMLGSEEAAAATMAELLPLDEDAYNARRDTLKAAVASAVAAATTKPPKAGAPTAGAVLATAGGSASETHKDDEGGETVSVDSLGDFD